MKNCCVVLFLLLGLSFIGNPYTLSGKSSKVTKVAVKLSSVERIPAPDPTGIVSNGELFDSGIMAVIWSPVPEGFRFRVYNKSTEYITILWSEVRFIDQNGGKHNVSHKGIQRSNMSEMESMKLRVIKPGENWQDVIFPSDSDYIDQEKELIAFGKGDPEKASDSISTYGKAGLRARPIFITSYKSKEIEKIINENQKKDPAFTFESYISGLSYKVELVLKLGEVKYTYLFNFKSELVK